MDRYAAKNITPETLQPKLAVDDEVSLGSMTRSVVRELERLAPHGAGNPVPLLVASHVRVAGEPRLMGKKNDHLSFYVTHEGASVRAVGFKMGSLFDSLKRARTVSLAFTPQINEWQGRESVELLIKDVRVEE